MNTEQVAEMTAVRQGVQQTVICALIASHPDPRGLLEVLRNALALHDTDTLYAGTPDRTRDLQQMYARDFLRLAEEAAAAADGQDPSVY
ncbi:hypothetical protein [Niveibacterium sp. SC-1]|uniref:hypothetical protein n=1 Tax=Niveibacterium sp. SC-1 TaxID=3135646 RepID=UPI00311EDA51